MEPGPRRAPWPRSLYARGALIVLAPILTIQLVLSVVFVQRLYADVTEQMTRNLLIDVRAVTAAIAAAPDADAARRNGGAVAGRLDLDLALPPAVAVRDHRSPYDVSGLTIRPTLARELPGVTAIDLDLDAGRVRLGLDTPHGPAAIAFDRRRVSARNPHQLPVLMAVVSLMLATIAWLFLRNQLRPVKRLAEAAEAFGKGRPVPYRPRGAVEVRQAGHAFLDMRARIERQIEQRTMMLSGVSHDLRTPLTRMRLAVEMMEDEAGAHGLRQDLDEMTTLVDEFLDFARGVASDEAVESDPVSIARAAVAKGCRGGAEVALGEVEGAGTASLRPAAVERALGNLVSNAVRYGTRALVSVAVGERAVRFTVEDDGPGIAEGGREAALRPFTRLDAARNQDRGSGVGLGLSIAADIARQHGGSLRLGQSEALGGLRADLVLAR